MSLQKLGRYELIRVLGKGAMGLVYEGLDPNLNRRVAVKTIKVKNLSAEAAAEYEIRFKVEAQSAARLQHPNIVSVYDSARDGDIAYMVMEFIHGDDLKHHLDQGTLYTLEQTLAIMQDLLAALGYAHAQNVVHRDIKPANLLIEQSGRIKLTDFGVARIQDSGEATRTQGTMVGTLKYMSPEQVQGRPVDARADIFAAGIVLYQLLTGKRPFDGSTDFAIIQQIVGHTPVAPTFFNSKLPPAIDAVVGRALAKARDQRFGSAKAFLQALQAASRDAVDATVVPPAGASTPDGQGGMTSARRAADTFLGSQSGLHSNPNVGQSTVTQEIELVYWKDIKDSHDVEDIQCFMAKFPSGIYADLARRRLRQLGVAAGDESDLGTSSGTATVLLPRGDQGYEPTMIQEWSRGVPASAPRPGTITSRASGPGDDAPSTVFQSTEQADWAPEPALGKRPGVASKMPAVALIGEVTLPPVPIPALPRAAPPQPVPPVKPFIAESSVVPPAKRAAPRQPATPRRMLRWAVAGGLLVALLVTGLGYSYSRLNSIATSARAEVAISAGVPPTVPALATPAALPTLPTLPTIAPTLLSPVAAAVMAPASVAVAPQVFSLGIDPPISKSAAEAKAIAEVKAAKKADREKEKLARQAQTQMQVQSAGAGSAAPDEPLEVTPATKRPAPVAAAAGALGASNPRQACEDRVLLGYQMCMTEQCAKRVFSSHPICLERRAMDDRRREAEQSRR